MSTSLLKEPTISLPAGQRTTFRVTPTLPAGRALADWAAFTCTLRADPLWPRSGPSIDGAKRADPVGDGWPVAATASGTVDGSTVVFVVTLPTGAGDHRYAIDFVGTGGTAGRVPIYPCTWLTLTANSTAFS
jgi:hypothetical protein